MHTFTFPLYVTDRNVAMLHFGSICKPVTVQLYVFVFVVSGPPIFPYFCQSLCSLFSSLCAFFLGRWALVRSYILSDTLGCWSSPPAFVYYRVQLEFVPFVRNARPIEAGPVLAACNQVHREPIHVSQMSGRKLHSRKVGRRSRKGNRGDKGESSDDEAQRQSSGG